MKKRWGACSGTLFPLIIKIKSWHIDKKSNTIYIIWYKRGIFFNLSWNTESGKMHGKWIQDYRSKRGRKGKLHCSTCGWTSCVADKTWPVLGWNGKYARNIQTNIFNHRNKEKKDVLVSFLSLILIFDYHDQTHNYIHQNGVFPQKLFARQGEIQEGQPISSFVQLEEDDIKKLRWTGDSCYRNSNNGGVCPL